ncbi:ABC transporter permease [Actinomadura sp. HBU206391]|uniref:ABC transporter permease n=1 Tax=Actinomadura sp. HBU206391 TaxID=2731692 RepID=UPI0016509C60|nr:ABC transporter permease [Actinomadura sp. HBU206391]MBC6458848.1 ABC transporter permease [Actinomadura sp. HBU206391]
MLKTSLAGLRARRLRMLLTALAIALGVAFITGTFVLTDTMQAGYDQKFGSSAGKVAVAVLPEGSGDQALPEGLLRKVRAVPGVTDVHATVRGDAPLLGKDGRAYGDMPTMGFSLPSTGPLQRHEVVTGRAPAAADEAVLDKATAEATGYRTGDSIKVLDPRGGPRTFRLVGTVELALDRAYRGAVGFTPATATAMTGAKGYAEIDVAGPVSTQAVAAAVGGPYEVITGRQLGDRLATANGADTKVLRIGLLLFGLVSLLVSAIVIYNTFAILIAQRMRELALLRCVGATRRQVFGGVLVEAAAVGLVGSLLGLAIGAALGAGAIAAIGFFGADLPAGAFALGLRTVAVGLVAGVVVTVLSALLPARAATRVAPVAALRSEAEPGTGRLRFGPFRIVVTVLLCGLGLGLAAFGALVMPVGESALAVTALAGGLTFLGAIALMPALVRPLARVIGAIPARVGLPGRLAMENSRRAPKRTATTTIALTIGVGLVTLFAVLGASVKATASDRLEQQFPVDYALRSQLGSDRTIPRALAETLRAAPEIGSVTEVRWADGGLDGDDRSIGTVSGPAIGKVVKPEIESGSFADLRTGTVALHHNAAGGRSAGQTVGVTTRQGPRTLRIAVVFSGDVPMPEILVPERDFDAYFGALGDTAIYLKVKDGVDAAAARTAVDAATKDHPAVNVASATSIKDQFSRAIDTMLMVFGGMLGLSILIALFGIANTLTLSVVERTRESALLRALGLTRRQLRRMLSVESMIMALIGALTGVVLGTLFGWAATRAILEGALFRLPYAQIVAFVAIAALAGLIAAVLPSRRAARASIVESLSSE